VVGWLAHFTCSAFLLEKSHPNVSFAISEFMHTMQKEDDATLPITGDGREGGCTATVVIIRGNKAFVANVGDSRAIVVQSEGCQRLTVDHNPSMPEEKKRVMDAGGMIFSGRVQGGQFQSTFSFISCFCFSSSSVTIRFA
jgi:serine/threonine protein phosphatase PrpC